MDKDDLIKNPLDCGPHVVLLGAGASLASFPNGDANGKKLPVMNNLTETLDLSNILLKSDINPNGNFEDIYSTLNNSEPRNEIEERTYAYFSQLKLPETTTLYDRLLLSLRRKDAIFTFNWDPFLFDAYQRNRKVAELPEIFFLHGNVRIGMCQNCHDKWGAKNDLCPNCGERFLKTPLLYPIKVKDYSKDPYISAAWENAEHFFSTAFLVTIFGYGAPASDVAAVDLLSKAWFKIDENRDFNRIEIINIERAPIWKNFSPRFQRILYRNSFDESMISKLPRRTCENALKSTTQGFVCEDFPLISSGILSEFQESVKYLIKHEIP